MVLGSLPLAILPPTFLLWRFVSSAFPVVTCGFARVDSDQGSGAATPGRCRRCFVRDWQPTTTGCAPTLLQKGLCVCAASPAPVFSSPVLDTEQPVQQVNRGGTSRQEPLPWCIVPQKRRESAMKVYVKRKDFPRRHSGKGISAIGPTAQAGVEDQGTGLLHSVHVASRPKGFLTAGAVAMAFSLSS